MMSLRSSDFLYYMDFAPSNYSQQPSLTRCMNYAVVTHIISSLCAINILLISPLYFSILHLGCQDWKKFCYPSSAPTARQSDLFTYNMVAMGLIEILSHSLYIVGAYTSEFGVAVHGLNMNFVCWSVKLGFHTLTCIEHYLAVVQPVTYLGLNKTGCSIKEIIIICIWMLLIFWGILVNFTSELLSIFICLGHTLFSFIVMFFCSIFVLWALKRPSPGQASSERKHVNRTKRRAFFIILTITSAVLLSLVWMLLSGALFTSPELHLKDKCLIMAFVPWVSLPSNLVLPILHLQRTRKLPQCFGNSQTGIFHG